MTVEENKDLVRRYFDTIWNKFEIAREPEFVAKDIVVHAPPIPGLPEGIAGPIQIVSTFRAAMPDLVLTNEDVFAEGDKVVQRWSTVGTHTGADLFGVPASGKQIRLTGINEFRVADGRLAERWGVIDALALLQQLGIVPTPGQ
jgi:steroid delta-isomerase-like uncharacterized protein